MNKKCDKRIHRFLLQEKKTKVPFSIKIHAFFCKSCRDEINLLKKNFVIGSQLSPFKTKFDLTDNIMYSLKLRNDIIKFVPLWQWFIAGLIILIGILTNSFTDTMIWLKNIFGSSLEVPINIILGSILTSYTVIAVFSFLRRTKNFSLHHHNK